ncbi:MAG: cell wall-associated hydrolase, invasion-associated protein, partial [Clostridia bacterium]|nr:cell wall-associated hydrolase, invasion-associated protein [Clostridia bacterium]
MLKLKKLLLFSAVFVMLLSLSTIIAYADENKTATVTATNLNLRSGPSTSDSIIGSLTKGQSITILKSTDAWYQISASNGKSGWVSSTYVSVNGAAVSRGNVTRTPSNAAADLGTEIVSFAKKQLGVKYVWGGTTPKGFDCSGFIKYVYDHFDIKIERVSSSQATQGVAVNKAD